MDSKEEFMNKASQLWDQLKDLENRSSDFYSFEQGFEQEINRFGNQAMQQIIGSEKRDRREKKTSDTI